MIIIRMQAFLYVRHLGFPTCKKSAKVVVVKWEILLELHSYSDSASISDHYTILVLVLLAKSPSLQCTYHNIVIFYCYTNQCTAAVAQIL